MLSEYPTRDGASRADLVRCCEISPLVPDSIPQLSRNALAGLLGLFIMPYTFTGQPAPSLPLYWMRASSPIGVQFIVAYGRKDILMQLAVQLETAHPWAWHYASRDSVIHLGRESQILE